MSSLFVYFYETSNNFIKLMSLYSFVGETTKYSCEKLFLSNAISQNTDIFSQKHPSCGFT